MAIVANNRLFFTPAAADPLSQSYTVGAGASLLVVKFTIEAPTNADGIVNPTAGGVKWGGSGGTNMVQAVYRKVSGAELRQCGIWYLVNPTVQTADIWVDLTASFAVAFEAVWFSGVDTAAALADVDDDATFSTSVTTLNPLVPSGTDNWLETCLYSGTSTNALAPQGLATESVDQAAAGHRSGMSWQSGISANVQPGWTKAGGSADLVLSAALFKPAATVLAGAGTAAGAGATSGAGAGIGAGVGSAAGIGTAVGVADSGAIESGTGTATGTGTAVGVIFTIGEPWSDATYFSDATAWADGGVATVSGSSTGIGLATAVGRSTTAAAGFATAVGTGAATAVAAAVKRPSPAWRAQPMIPYHLMEA